MIQVAQFRIESSRAGRRTTYQQKGKEISSNTEASTTALAVVNHGLRCLVKRQAVDTPSKDQRQSRDRSLQSVQNSPEDGSRLRSEFTSSCSQARNEGPWSTGHILEASKTRCSSARWCNEHSKLRFQMLLNTQNFSGAQRSWLLLGAGLERLTEINTIPSSVIGGDVHLEKFEI